jgi:hypothetical protein
MNTTFIDQNFSKLKKFEHPNKSFNDDFNLDDKLQP